MTANAKNGAVKKDDAPKNLASLIWQIADLLRGPYKEAQYGSIILPFTVLRRLDCVLEPTKKAVLKVAATIKDLDNLRLDERLKLERATINYKFYNTSKFTMTSVLGDIDNLRANFEDYVAGFSPNIRDVFEKYSFVQRLHELEEHDRLFMIAQRFTADDVDLHPDRVSNADMGSAFEELIRRFADSVDEKPGEHFTPRDAIKLMVGLILAGDEDLQTNPRPLRTVYDPTAGTGGMLSIAEDQIKAHNSTAEVTAYAQEVSPESYAICKADMLIKGQDVKNIAYGNTLTQDKFQEIKFDLMFSNPPYGYDWKLEQKSLIEESERGFNGRFGPGLPRVSDGQMLFLMHLVSKMQPVKDGGRGSRIAIVMSGSPLFVGGAGSGESEIRRHLFENDFVEAIIGLPTDMFYNTGISTFVWILANNKAQERRGQVQLIDATSMFRPMRKNLGSKRRYMSDPDISAVVKIHGEFANSINSRILKNEDFGYRSITVERPLRLSFQVTSERLKALSEDPSLAKSGMDVDSLISSLGALKGKEIIRSRSAFLKALDAALRKSRLALKPSQYKIVWQAFSEHDPLGEIALGAKGAAEPDSDLRDAENVPLTEDVADFYAREVAPHVTDGWIDHEKTRIGYEVPFTRYFYKFDPPRAIETIDEDLRKVTLEISRALGLLPT